MIIIKNQKMGLLKRHTILQNLLKNAGICPIFGVLLLFLFSLSSSSLIAQTHAQSDVPVGQVLIPAGKVRLGSSPQEKEYGYRIGSASARLWKWYDREIDRTVLVKEFAMDRFPVTHGDYLQFVEKTGHRIPFISEKEYLDQGFLVHSYSKVKKFLWINNTPPEALKKHPVLLVSVGDAETFCQWKGEQWNRSVGIGNQGSRTFRLPTEDEWEKAAKGTDQRYFPWGNDWQPSFLNSASNGHYFTTAVDQYPQGKSSYGVYDLSGNVFEWTATPAEWNPQKHILKSCSWDDAPGICRSAARHGRLKSSRHILIGFRCVSVREEGSLYQNSKK